MLDHVTIRLNNVTVSSVCPCPVVKVPGCIDKAALSYMFVISLIDVSLHVQVFLVDERWFEVRSWSFMSFHNVSLIGQPLFWHSIQS